MHRIAWITLDAAGNTCVNRNHARPQFAFASKGVETSKERLANHLRPLAMSGYGQDVIEVPFFDLVRSTAADAPREESLFLCRSASAESAFFGAQSVESRAPP